MGVAMSYLHAISFLKSNHELITIKSFSDHTCLRMRRWANTLLTGITLRQYSSLLYELLMAQSDIFQHCASAREFGAQIGDLECGEAISSPNIIIS